MMIKTNIHVKNKPSLKSIPLNDRMVHVKDAEGNVNTYLLCDKCHYVNAIDNNKKLKKFVCQSCQKKIDLSDLNNKQPYISTLHSSDDPYYASTSHAGLSNSILISEQIKTTTDKIQYQRKEFEGFAWMISSRGRVYVHPKYRITTYTYNCKTKQLYQIHFNNGKLTQVLNITSGSVERNDQLSVTHINHKIHSHLNKQFIDLICDNIHEMNPSIKQVVSKSNQYISKYIFELLFYANYPAIANEISFLINQGFKIKDCSFDLNLVLYILFKKLRKRDRILLKKHESLDAVFLERFKDSRSIKVMRKILLKKSDSYKVNQLITYIVSLLMFNAFLYVLNERQVNNIVQKLLSRLEQSYIFKIHEDYYMYPTQIEAMYRYLEKNQCVEPFAELWYDKLIQGFESTSTKHIRLSPSTDPEDQTLLFCISLFHHFVYVFIPQLNYYRLSINIDVNSNFRLMYLNIQNQLVKRMLKQNHQMNFNNVNIYAFYLGENINQSMYCIDFMNKDLFVRPYYKHSMNQKMYCLINDEGMELYMNENNNIELASHQGFFYKRKNQPQFVDYLYDYLFLNNEF